MRFRREFLLLGDEHMVCTAFRAVPFTNIRRHTTTFGKREIRVIEIMLLPAHSPLYCCNQTKFVTGSGGIRKTRKAKSPARSVQGGVKKEMTAPVAMEALLL